MTFGVGRAAGAAGFAAGRAGAPAFGGGGGAFGAAGFAAAGAGGRGAAAPPVAALTRSGDGAPSVDLRPNMPATTSTPYARFRIRSTNVFFFAGTVRPVSRAASSMKPSATFVSAAISA